MAGHLDRMVGIRVFVHVRGERVGAGLIVERVGGAGADQRCRAGVSGAGGVRLAGLLRADDRPCFGHARGLGFGDDIIADSRHRNHPGGWIEVGVMQHRGQQHERQTVV